MITIHSLFGKVFNCPLKAIYVIFEVSKTSVTTTAQKTSNTAFIVTMINIKLLNRATYLALVTHA